MLCTGKSVSSMVRSEDILKFSGFKISTFVGWESGLVGSKLDSQSKGRGFESLLILYKLEMVSKPFQIRLLYPNLVDSSKNIGSQMRQAKKTLKKDQQLFSSPSNFRSARRLVNLLNFSWLSSLHGHGQFARKDVWEWYSSLCRQSNRDQQTRPSLLRWFLIFIFLLTHCFYGILHSYSIFNKNLSRQVVFGLVWNIILKNERDNGFVTL